MLKKISIGLFIVFILFLMFIGVSIGYNIYNVPKELDIQIVENTKTEDEDLKEANADFFEEEEKAVDSINVPKITPSTKMVYKYFYKADNITETVEDVPPYFLLDFTRQDLEREFELWQVESFSEKEVVMKTVIDGESTQHYIIGEYDGFLAVFYEKEINENNLKEITDIPLSSLSSEEQAKIKEGIKIFGKDELIKFLQNYDI